MSKLQELIQRLCPDGVEYKKLGEVCEVVIAPKKLNKKDYQDTGLYPIIDQGKSMIVGYTDNEEVLLPAKEYVLFGDHTRNIKYYDGAFAQGADGLKILTSKDIVLARFLYYSMQCLVIEDRGYNRHWTVVSPLLIPIPPLEVQEEIVRILDRFSDYAAELQAELQARKEQYEYYRNLLLTFNPAGCAGEADDEQEGSVTTRGGHSYPIQWKTMGEVGTFIRGNGLQKKDFTESGVGCIHYGQIYTYYGTFTTETKSFVSEEFAKKLRKAQTGDLVIATTSENVEDVGKAVVWLGKDEIAISGDAYVYKHNQNPRYIAYLLQTDRFLAFKRMNVSGTKVTRISGDSLAKYPIPIPPLELQEKIVAILDRFETLVNDLSEGLPAEIAAVKEQYEYYRNRLLTFKEKTA